MLLELYQEVALTCDLPDAGLKAGDVATLVDWVPHPEGGEGGCVLEVVNLVDRQNSSLPHPNPSPRAGEGLLSQWLCLKSLRPLWEKGFRDEGKRCVSQPGVQCVGGSAAGDERSSDGGNCATG